MIITSLFYIHCLFGTGTCTSDDDSPSPPHKINKREKAKSCKELDAMRMELYKNAIEALKEPGNGKLSEEAAFGRTVSETLSRFNPRQRAIARKRISDVLFEVEMGVENLQPNSNMLPTGFPHPNGFYAQPNYTQLPLTNSQQTNMYKQSSQFSSSQPEDSPNSHYTF